MIGIVGHWIRRAREVGAADAIKIVANIVEGFCFDFRYRTNTAQRVSLENLLIAAASRKHGTKYDPSPIWPLRRICNKIGINSNDVFIDFGCGKGRTLLLMSRLGLRRVIGVEFSPELCAIARQNVATFGSKRPICPVEIIEADAALFQIGDDATIFYFFNPFDAIIMRSVIDHIAESWVRRPRRLVIIYDNPAHRRVIDETVLFCLLADVKIMARHYCLYEAKP